MSRPAKTGPDQEVGGATHPIDSAMQRLNSWGYHFRNNFFLSFFLVLCMDVDVENLRIVSGSADNKICVSLISSQVSVLNARGGWGGGGHSTKFIRVRYWILCQWTWIPGSNH